MYTFSQDPVAPCLNYIFNKGPLNFFDQHFLSALAPLLKVVRAHEKGDICRRTGPGRFMDVPWPDLPWPTFLDPLSLTESFLTGPSLTGPFLTGSLLDHTFLDYLGLSLTGTFLDRDFPWPGLSLTQTFLDPPRSPGGDICPLWTCEIPAKNHFNFAHNRCKGKSWVHYK